MASIKVKFRQPAIDGHKGAIYYQIIHRRKVRNLSTDYRLMPDEWNECCPSVASAHNSSQKTLSLSISEKIRREMDILAQIAQRFDSSCTPYSADDVIEEYRKYMANSSLFNYMERIIVSLKQNGKLRTAETYAATLNSFKKFLCEANIQGRSGKEWDIRLEYLDSGLMESYQA